MNNVAKRAWWTGRVAWWCCGVGVVGVMAALGGLRAADSSEPVTLKPKWKTGQKQVMRVTMNQEQDISGAALPSPMKQTVTQVQDLTLKVMKELPGGGHEVELGYSRIRMNTQMGESGSIVFDTETAGSDDTGNPMAPVLRAMTSLKFRLVTDAQGELVRVEGLKEAKEKLASLVPPMMAGMLDGMLSEDSVKQMGALAQGLPNKPVKAGDSWPHKSEVPLGPLGKMQVAMTMTCKGWETLEGRRCVRIDHTGTLSAQAGDGTNMISLVSLAGDTQGQSWFDPEAGITRESRSVQKMTMQMKAMGQEMTSRMTQYFTNQLVELTGP